jgi:hypothetical protein
MNDLGDSIERTMREHLGGGAALDASRREALLRRIGAASPAGGGAARPPRPRARSRLAAWSWAALGAAAVVVVGLAVRHALRPEPIPPTAVLADLLGPLGGPGPSRPAPPVAGPPAGSPIEGALAAFWQDLEGPVSIGQAVFEGSRPPSGSGRGSPGGARPAPADAHKKGVSTP